MRLSQNGEQFLTAWIRNELNYRGGAGPAKLLERKHRAKPAGLAMLIAAWIPDPREQYRRAETAGDPGPLEWPWKDEEELHARLREARTVLGPTTSRTPEHV